MTPGGITPLGLVAVSPAHAEALAAIHRSAFQPGEIWGTRAFAGQLSLPGAYGLVDARGGLVLARIAASEAEVLTLAVAPAWRRQGLGTALLQGAMTEGAARGATVMFLEVSTGNHSALGLYEKAGFRRIGRRRRYYADGLDALVLAAELNPSSG